MHSIQRPKSDSSWTSPIVAPPSLVILARALSRSATAKNTWKCRSSSSSWMPMSSVAVSTLPGPDRLETFQPNRPR
jgi:hypothetical protein